MTTNNRTEIARHLTDGQRWGVAIFRNANDRYEVATLNSSASGVRNELTSLALSWHATEAAARAAANVEVAHQRAHLRERGLPVY